MAFLLAILGALAIAPNPTSCFSAALAGTAPTHPSAVLLGPLTASLAAALAVPAALLLSKGVVSPGAVAAALPHSLDWLLNCHKVLVAAAAVGLDGFVHPKRTAVGLAEEVRGARDRAAAAVLVAAVLAAASGKWLTRPPARDLPHCRESSVGPSAGLPSALASL